MKGNILIIGIVCLVIAACVAIYILAPNPKNATISFQDDTADRLEIREDDREESQLSDTSEQHEKPENTAQEKTDTETPDWQKKPTLEELAKQFSDPWKDFERTDNLQNDEIETAEVDITDPSSYDALKKEMVGRYGNTDAVEYYMETWLKVVSNPENMEHKAEFAKAVYELAPSPETKKSMEIINAIVNNDLETLEKYSEPAKSNSRFQDVERYFVGVSNHADAFRNLRRANPKRSAEFEKFILEQARRDPHIDFDKISKDIEDSYKNEADKDKTTIVE